jgi:hypothetical protein
VTEIHEFREQHTRPAPGPLPVRVAFGGLGVAGLALAGLHLRFGGVVDPARDTVSDYVSAPGGTALLAVAVLAAATGTAALAVALGRALPRPAPVVALLLLAAAGLLGSAVFPTNALGSALTGSAVLHRYTAGVFFLAVPLAAQLVRRRTGGGGALLLTSLLLGALFLVSHVPLLFPGSPAAGPIDLLDPRGLAERALLVADLALLAGLAASARGALTGRAVRA